MLARGASVFLCGLLPRLRTSPEDNDQGQRSITSDLPMVDLPMVEGLNDVVLYCMYKYIFKCTEISIPEGFVGFTEYFIPDCNMLIFN